MALNLFPRMNSSQFLLEMRGIRKSFPGVKALRGVDLTLCKREVLALLGENGAGKSTLIKTLAGVHRAEAGTILVDGREVVFRSPHDSRDAGIGVIYQEFNLVPGLSAADNIFLGQEKTRGGFVNERQQNTAAAKLFARLQVEVEPSALCQDLSVAQQQIVEIAKALAFDARIIVMDEPSATLTPQEVEHLFQVVRELKSQGIGVIYISHRLEEIFEIADRVTVLRDGEGVGTKSIGDLTRESMIEMMVGRKLENEFPKVRHTAGEERLVARGLNRRPQVKDVSFTLRRGEIVGLTGLVGAGRTETARLIFGADLRESGTVLLDGRELKINSPRDAISEGICLLTEDRKAQGLVLGQSVQANFGLPNLSTFSRSGFVDGKRERERFSSFVESLKIRIASYEQTAQTLSGGNQQKIVLAKWLERNAEVIIFDEPTRGIDVGAKYEIYLLMNRLASEGKAILMISSELPEVLGMSDRILVMHNGGIVGEITDVEHATQEQVMRLAVGDSTPDHSST